MKEALAEAGTAILVAERDPGIQLRWNKYKIMQCLITKQLYLWQHKSSILEFCMFKTEGYIASILTI